MPASVDLCRQAGVDEVWLLTSSDIDSFPGVDRVFSRVPIDDTPAIYRSCDVLVKLSYVEGMFGPPLEIFHCGGTAIVYEVTGHDEYIVHGRNSYVAARDDEQQVVEYLSRLKEDASELQRLKNGALETAAAWPDWGESSEQFGAAMKRILQQREPSPAYIRKWIEEREQEKNHIWFLKEILRFAERERETGEALTDLHNFVQMYTKVGDAPVDPDRVRWFYYHSDEETTVSATIAIDGLPFWVRIDPSVRIGVIIIDRITVMNLTSAEVLMNLESAEDFNPLFLSGTIKRIGWQQKAAFLSYGIDPWFYLPPITDAAVGDELEITMTFKELGVTQFANRYSAASLTTAQQGTTGLKRRLLQPVRSPDIDDSETNQIDPATSSGDHIDADRLWRVAGRGRNRWRNHPGYRLFPGLRRCRCGRCAASTGRKRSSIGYSGHDDFLRRPVERGGACFHQQLSRQGRYPDRHGRRPRISKNRPPTPKRLLEQDPRPYIDTYPAVDLYRQLLAEQPDAVGNRHRRRQPDQPGPPARFGAGSPQSSRR